MKTIYEDRSKELVKKNAEIYNNIEAVRNVVEKTGGTSHRKERYKKEFEKIDQFFQQFNMPKESTALDIGCSGGRYIQLLIMNNLKPYGIDTSKVALNYANSIYQQKAEFINASATDLPFKENAFDAVLCIELLHHLDDDNMEKTIENISTLIKPGGIFICDVRNSLNPLLWYYYRKRDGKYLTLKTRSLFKMIEILKKNDLKVFHKESLFSPITLFAPYVILFCKYEPNKNVRNKH